MSVVQINNQRKKKRTVPSLLQQKGKTTISALTAYDYTTARWMDQGGADMILVGDSLGNCIQGHDSTLPVTLDHMVYHTACVVRGTQNALVIADMPFGSFQVDAPSTIRNALRLVQEGGAHAVKLEGASDVVLDAIASLTRDGVPVVGHLGLTPQSVLAMGGFKRQGKTEAQAQKIIQDAIALQEAGAFAVVLECIPDELAAEITHALSHALTIGIGSGPSTDGQILVSYDLLGMLENSPPFATRMADFNRDAIDTVQSYIAKLHQQLPHDAVGAQSNPSRLYQAQ